MANQKTIIQVLGNIQSYSNVKFRLKDEDQIIKSYLSSIAYNKLTGSNAELRFYIPESVIVDIAEDLSSLKDHKTIPQKIIDHHKPWLENKIQGCFNFKIKVIPSIGSYVFEQGNSNYFLTFNNYMDNITMFLFLDLLNVQEKLIIDISTGLNIYTQALTDVAKSLIVYNDLQCVLQDNQDFHVKLLIVPPIFSKVKNQTFSIEIHNYTAKTFFDFPYTSLNLNNNLVSSSNLRNFERTPERIHKNAPKLIKKARNLIRLTRLSFNAIKYNTPLIFFEKELIELNMDQGFIDSELRRIKTIKNYLKKCSELKIDNNQLSIHHLKALKTNIINYIFTLALYMSLKTFYDDLIMMDKLTLQVIKSKFPEVYTHLNLGSNMRFLERDIYTLKKFGRELKKNETKSLKELMEKEQEDLERDDNNQSIASDEKRNFFAHSGFQRNCIWLKKNDNNDLEVYYHQSYFDNIRSWLLDPEK